MHNEINTNLINNLITKNVIPQNIVKLSENFVPDTLKLNDMVFVQKLLKLDGEKMLLFSDKGKFTLNQEFVPKVFESGKILVNKLKNDYILKFVSEIKKDLKAIDFDKISSKFSDVKFNIKNLFKVLDFNLKGEILAKTIDNFLNEKIDFKQDLQKNLKNLFEDKDFSKNLFKELKEKFQFSDYKDVNDLKSKKIETDERLREVLKEVKKIVSKTKEHNQSREFPITKKDFIKIVSHQVARLDYNKTTDSLKDLNLELKNGAINLKSLFSTASNNEVKEVSLLKLNELIFNKPSHSAIDSFKILKSILNLPSTSLHDGKLEQQVKDFFKEFEALSSENEGKISKNFKREFFNGTTGGLGGKSQFDDSTKNIATQLKNFEQIINGQEALDRLNPILAAKGEPILLLFPNLFRNYMSSIEVSYLPFFEKEIREKNDKSRKKNKYTQLKVKVEFAKLGKIEIRIKYNSYNLFAEIVVQDQKKADFIESKIGKLKYSLKRLVKLNIYTKISVGNYSNDCERLVSSNCLA